jgi:LysM repeat protein
MTRKIKYTHIRTFAAKIVSLFLVMVIVLAALPQSSMAATVLGATDASCKTTYTVKSGDYLIKIANAYDVDWRDLADANDLKSPYVVYSGLKLCIPRGSSSGSTGTTSTTSTAAKITVTKSKNTITISSSKLPTNNTYFVKVDNANNKKLEWYRVGILKTGKQSSVKESFKLPDALRNTSSVNVCLKNMSNDAVVQQPQPGSRRHQIQFIRVELERKMEGLLYCGPGFGRDRNQHVQFPQKQLLLRKSRRNRLLDQDRDLKDQKRYFRHRILYAAK